MERFTSPGTPPLLLPFLFILLGLVARPLGWIGGVGAPVFHDDGPSLLSKNVADEDEKNSLVASSWHYLENPLTWNA